MVCLLYFNFCKLQQRYNMIAPPHLQKGDKIGIVAPAGKISREDLRPALDRLHAWGLEIEMGANLMKEYHQFSGTDEERKADLQSMLNNPTINAILCARGGYGSMRIIDQLDFNEFCKKPKWIIGYSDITVLHSHIHKNFGIQTLHAVMPIHFTQNEEALESLRKALFYGEFNYAIEPCPLNKPGEAQGLLVGGNLSLLYALNASSSDIDTEGKILFLEDLAEQFYHLDRMMVSMKRSGKLKNLEGLIVGGLTDMKDSTTPFGKTSEEIILDAVSTYSYPVCFRFPSGHLNKNLALAFGRQARLSVSENSISLNYVETNPA